MNKEENIQTKIKSHLLLFLNGKLFWFTIFVLLAAYSFGSTGLVAYLLIFPKKTAVRLFERAEVKRTQIEESIKNCSKELSELRRNCFEGWKFSHLDNLCYKDFELQLTFEKAQGVCQDLQADLISINSKEKNVDVMKNLAPGEALCRHIWIGLTKKPDDIEFKWTNGSSLSGYRGDWHGEIANSKTNFLGVKMHLTGTAKGKWEAIPPGIESRTQFPDCFICQSKFSK